MAQSIENSAENYMKNKMVFDLSTTSVPNDSDMICNWNCPKIEQNPNQKIYIMRHGERVDFTFGLKWVECCFDKSGHYVRKDLNQPKQLPIRSDFRTWIYDTPITRVGMHQAYLTGEAMKNRDVKINYAYCSPAFRCVQTCNEVLKGLGIRDNIKIRIEPGFYEWLGFFTDVPDWCTPEELLAAGFNIDMDYVPIRSRAQLRAEINETIQDDYQRHYNNMQAVLKQINTANVLISSHGDSLDTCSRQLIGQQPMSTFDIVKFSRISYCSVAAVEKANDKWTLVDPPCLSVTHSGNLRFSLALFERKNTINVKL